jgi:NADH dehydrogenase/NADH:ubiquinone oxidoreductase subunit G
MVGLIINGVAHNVPEGTTVLEAARQAGIDIPTLCHHPALKPVGSCKICVVELADRSGPTVRPSCLLKVREGLTVMTDSPLARQARAKALVELARMAPQSRTILDLARRYGVELPEQADGCIRCRLCLRVCRDVVGQGALAVERRGDQSFIVPVDGRCLGCGTCANICPTGAIRLEDHDQIRTIMIRDEVIGRLPLVRCEVCHRMFATETFRQRVADLSTRNHPDVKEHHQRCPTCTKIMSTRTESDARLKMR